MILQGPPSLTRSRLGAGLFAVALLLLPWAPTLAQQPKEQPASPRELRQKQIDVLRQLLMTLEEQQRAEEKDAVRLGVRVKAAHALGQLVQQKNTDALQAKEIQRLKELIEEAKAHVDVATVRLRNLQAELERLSKAGPTPGAPENEIVRHLQRRLALLEEQLRAKDLSAAQVRQFQEEKTQVEGLLKRLREEAAAKARPAGPHGEGDFQVIRLRAADATQASKVLDELFNGPPRKGDGAPRPERVRIVVDERNNALLLRASPADLAVIRNLLDKSLDVRKKL